MDIHPLIYQLSPICHHAIMILRIISSLPDRDNCSSLAHHMHPWQLLWFAIWYPHVSAEFTKTLTHSDRLSVWKWKRNEVTRFEKARRFPLKDRAAKTASRADMQREAQSEKESWRFPHRYEAAGLSACGLLTADSEHWLSYYISLKGPRGSADC